MYFTNQNLFLFKKLLLKRKLSAIFDALALIKQLPISLLLAISLTIFLLVNLWFSTILVKLSYEAKHEKEIYQILIRQKDVIEISVLQAESAPVLYDSACHLGMIYAYDTTYLVQNINEEWVKIGFSNSAEENTNLYNLNVLLYENIHSNSENIFQNLVPLTPILPQTLEQHELIARRVHNV